MSEEIGKKYLALYGDGHHEQVVLGELLNKGGAAGKIYRDNSHPKSVAKIYHDRNKSETNRKKLEAMLLNRPNIPTIPYKGKEYIQIAWPTALLEDEQGYCVGYLMPEIETKEAISLDHLMQKAVRQKLGLSERYIDRVFAAYNSTSVVAALHACKHYIVDLKPANVSIYKNTKLVALFDCDGFSICGERDARYPAEYVSEEYIYPEGMQQTCQQMGEEQDKFALAVIIFRLLNEGIHPFSGMPRKDDAMLSIQERIAEYHYAYGIWPDAYQAPHPYSIHDYFDKTTMNMFERAFTKGNERPTALEWQTQLEFILKNLKQCKKDHNHAYFTSKGCGLCMVNEKIKARLNDYKKQQEEPQTVRGMDLKTLETEDIPQKQQDKEQRDHLLTYGYYGFICVYLLFFTFFSKIISLFKEQLLATGIFIQLILFLLVAFLGRKTLEYSWHWFPNAKNQNIFNMLNVYALICLLLGFVTLNELSWDIFTLSNIDR
jgi:DNA-binding helix-hairpin-helix protein with protein kinase domain